IWLLGAKNNVALENTVGRNSRYGIVVSQGVEEGSASTNDRVQDNLVQSPSGYDLAWDGVGDNDCFSGNSFATSAPANIELLYGCDDRPFTGVANETVGSDARLTAADPSRPQVEPPLPRRPRCQRGAPGCDL
ncbi:MAG: hypothetical protein QOH26_2079, partial [Actinomycetota bacterium]|nr:hypothetical protein [Actinomycetota bacterium]